MVVNLSDGRMESMVKQLQTSTAKPFSYWQKVGFLAKELCGFFWWRGLLGMREN
jgi:hypothetical protein